MKTIEEIKKMLAKHKEELKKKYKVKDIGVFGSYVRRERNKKSDLDILVEFEEDAHLGLIEFISLQNFLSDLLGIKVDLVEKKCLKPHIGERILQEVVYV